MEPLAEARLFRGAATFAGRSRAWRITDGHSLSLCHWSSTNSKEFLVRQSLTILAVSAAVLALLPKDVAAQGHPQTREGFFIGLGVGGGTLGCEGCGDRESGLGAHLKLGGTLSPKLLIGAESGGWTKEEGGIRLTHANLSALAQFYPSATAGFFLKGGIGLSRLEVSASGGSVSDEGLGLTAGLGYDVRLGSNFSLSPYLSFAWGDFDGGTANHGLVGVGVTWH
jgi:hypothetical protein